MEAITGIPKGTPYGHSAVSQGMISDTIHSLSTVADVKAIPKVQQSEDQTQGSSKAPERDEYIPEEEQEPSGRYWLGKDEDGQSRIYFDDPDRADDAPEKQDELPAADDPDQDKRVDGLDQDKKADDPEKKVSGDKAESCTVNTDKVDREIEKLKKKQEELERQINAETDDTKIKELEKELAQVESELRRKDNDAYRRQHAVFS